MTVAGVALLSTHSEIILSKCTHFTGKCHTSVTGSNTGSTSMDGIGVEFSAPSDTI